MIKPDFPFCAFILKGKQFLRPNQIQMQAILMNSTKQHKLIRQRVNNSYPNKMYLAHIYEVLKFIPNILFGISFAFLSFELIFLAIVYNL